MATASNGDPTRRLRYDDLAGSRADDGAEEVPGYSGRRVVSVALLVLLVVWGGLSVVFRGWRDRYRERAAFGASQVAPAIDPLARSVPPGIDPAAWRQAVADTHAMLVSLTASDLLDRAQLQTLRAELTARVARARPETARAVLAGLWDDLADRAGPYLKAPRPKILPPRSAQAPRKRGLHSSALAPSSEG